MADTALKGDKDNLIQADFVGKRREKFTEYQMVKCIKPLAQVEKGHHGEDYVGETGAIQKRLGNGKYRVVFKMPVGIQAVVVDQDEIE